GGGNGKACEAQHEKQRHAEGRGGNAAPSAVDAVAEQGTGRDVTNPRERPQREEQRRQQAKAPSQTERRGIDRESERDSENRREERRSDRRCQDPEQQR